MASVNVRSFRVILRGLDEFELAAVLHELGFELAHREVARWRACAALADDVLALVRIPFLKGDLDARNNRRKSDRSGKGQNFTERRQGADGVLYGVDTPDSTDAGRVGGGRDARAFLGRKRKHEGDRSGEGRDGAQRRNPRLRSQTGG